MFSFRITCFLVLSSTATSSVNLMHSVFSFHENSAELFLLCILPRGREFVYKTKSNNGSLLVNNLPDNSVTAECQNKRRYSGIEVQSISVKGCEPLTLKIKLNISKIN